MNQLYTPETIEGSRIQVKEAIARTVEDHTPILEIFTSQLAIDVPDIDTDLIDSGLLDSLAMVTLIAQLETDFSFTVAFDQLDIEDFRSVRKIAAYVAKSTS